MKQAFIFWPIVKKVEPEPTKVEEPVKVVEPVKEETSIGEPAPTIEEPETRFDMNLEGNY